MFVKKAKIKSYKIIISEREVMYIRIYCKTNLNLFLTSYMSDFKIL